MMRAYLDQNILGYVRGGQVRLPVVEDVVWLYSVEHLAEISRGSDASLLSVLKDLKAQEIEVPSDDFGQMSNEAYVHDYACPIERYGKYLEVRRSNSFDQTCLTDLVAGFAGGTGSFDLQSLQVKILCELEGLLGADELQRVLAVVDLKGHLAEIVGHLREAQPLESLREALGFHKGRAGNFRPEKALHEIWKKVSEEYGNVTADRFFGLQDSRSNYERIVCYHTILNFMGFRTDKGISRSAKIPNIMSDAVHIAHAAYCHLLLSADPKLTDKAIAIYSYMGIETEVLRLTPAQVAA